ncbi:MAG: formate--tetrahydrofolate ligase, partial [Clostridia bacterium]|nr:formate--tetrahydrofolate ligase [Clostridia bacterium]
VAIAGRVLLMPGLPKVPAGSKMTIDCNNKITGLF